MGAAADRLGRVGKQLRTLPQEAVAAGSRDLRQALLVSLKRDTGGDRKLSGLRNGKPQTIKVTQRTLGNVTFGHVMAGPPKQRAPWFWMEEGTRPGVRGARGRRTYRGSHPGTPARQTWTRPVQSTLPQVRADIERRWRQALRG